MSIWIWFLDTKKVHKSLKIPKSHYFTLRTAFLHPCVSPIWAMPVNNWHHQHHHLHLHTRRLASMARNDITDAESFSRKTQELSRILKQIILGLSLNSSVEEKTASTAKEATCLWTTILGSRSTVTNGRASWQFELWWWMAEKSPVSNKSCSFLKIYNESWLLLAVI